MYVYGTAPRAVQSHTHTYTPTRLPAPAMHVARTDHANHAGHASRVVASDVATCTGRASRASRASLAGRVSRHRAAHAHPTTEVGRPQRAGGAAGAVEKEMGDLRSRVGTQNSNTPTTWEVEVISPTTEVVGSRVGDCGNLVRTPTGGRRVVGQAWLELGTLSHANNLV